MLSACSFGGDWATGNGSGVGRPYAKTDRALYDGCSTCWAQNLSCTPSVFTRRMPRGSLPHVQPSSFCTPCTMPHTPVKRPPAQGCSISKTHSGRSSQSWPSLKRGRRAAACTLGYSSGMGGAKEKARLLINSTRNHMNECSRTSGLV